MHMQAQEIKNRPKCGSPIPFSCIVYIYWSFFQDNNHKSGKWILPVRHTPVDQNPLQESSSTWSHFVVKLSSRARKADVAAATRRWKRRADHRTLVQAVTEGHLGQLHLWPWVVQYLPAPLQRAQDALLLKLGFGTHVEPRAQNTSHDVGTRTALCCSPEKRVHIFRKRSITQIWSITILQHQYLNTWKITALSVKGEFILHFFTQWFNNNTSIWHRFTCCCRIIRYLLHILQPMSQQSPKKSHLAATLLHSFVKWSKDVLI